MFTSRFLVSALALAAGFVFAIGSAAAESKATVGKPAPDFTLTDVNGKKVKLSDFKGKTVVLEWFNPQCPFVKYAHGEGPLKDASKKPGAGNADVVWLAINSGAAGKQGNGVELNKQARADWKMDYPVLIDDSGKVGRMYDAKTTPHMYVVDAKGTLVYRGALDSAPLGRAKGGVVNYVQAALDDLAAGRPVATAETQSYGCGVKY
ncbi:redoxin family protein [Haliangium sp.]|uniref:redoxin family protein n=1 Tax=Haliangium sp. TaxID=2663208 RepID=UPI003D0E8798